MWRDGGVTATPGTLLAPLSPRAQLRAGRLARRLVQLYVGLALYGLTLAMMIRSRLGNAPWDVLHQGLADHLGIGIGTALIIVSGLVLLAWIPLREVPGLGTISNAVMIGVVADVVLAVLPAPHGLALRLVLMVGGIVGGALATAMYIGAQLGPGPRDGLMTGLHRRTGRPIGVVRTLLEVSVVLIGWALGGRLGIGTLLYAVAIGPLVQRMLPGWVVALPLGGEERRRVGGDHHLDGGEALVAQPGLAQDVDATVGERRPDLARSEVVHDHDAAALDQVGDGVDPCVLG